MSGEDIWMEYYFPAHYKEKMLPAYERYLNHWCSDCVPNSICETLVSEIADIKQYADGEKLQNERDRLTVELQKLKRVKAQFIKESCKKFNDGRTKTSFKSF